MGFTYVNFKHPLFYFCFITKKLDNLRVKIQVLGKLNKANHRHVQIQTKEFDGEQISGLHYKNRVEQSKVFKQLYFKNPAIV